VDLATHNVIILAVPVAKTQAVAVAVERIIIIIIQVVMVDQELSLFVTLKL
jgi:hypothetical protein